MFFLDFADDALETAAECRYWLQHREAEFFLQIETAAHYQTRFLQSGFLDGQLFMPSWENGIVLIPKKPRLEQVESILNHYSQQLEQAIIGRNNLEFITKAGILFRFHEEWEVESSKPGVDFHRYGPFATYNLAFGAPRLDFDFRIDFHEVCFRHSDIDSKIAFHCSVNFPESNVAPLRFTVLAYTPLGFVRDAPNHLRRGYNAHILTNRFNVLDTGSYLEASVKHLQASSVTELRLKLCTLSDSLFSSHVLASSLTSGEQFHLVYQPERNNLLSNPYYG